MAKQRYSGKPRSPARKPIKRAAVEIRETKLGKALFAGKDFKTEAVVGQVTGDYIYDPEYGSDYCIALSDHVSIEPGEPFRYLNHSCDPNCELVVVELENTDELELILQSLRDVSKGEELTIDYGWSADAAIECLCGSSKCRGWIVSDQELSQLQLPNA